jgi:hypothetical protein
MNNKINKKADAIAKVIREILETTEEEAKAVVSKYLNKTSKTLAYKQYQKKLEPKLKKELEETVKRAYALLTDAVNNSTQIEPYNTKPVLTQIEKNTARLYIGALNEYRLAIPKIVRAEKLVALREAIFEQTQKALSKPVSIKIQRGGKTQTWGFKEYMEANTRTEIQKAISENMLEINANSNIVFYISNVFRDSADDHADYQGKFYYDKNYKSFNLTPEIKTQISQVIKQKQMLSVQAVRDGEPYLTTRPNCRHTLSPVAIDRVLFDSEQSVVDDFKLSTGRYRDENYKNTQEQRYNERQIRKYKARKEQNERLYQQTQDRNYLIASKKDNVLVRKYQNRQRQLIASNPTLERDYRRETKDIIIKDLGARYRNA